ncbi:hypothetical protein [Pedobacter sp. N23S346]|uniref:hypothetical protein n=1 Tax=Pedobacter sp. N23S346 TaxID=3402750 RepID=UPI003AC24F45
MHQRSNPPQHKVARTAPKINLYYNQIEPLRYRSLNFDELIRHQIQALIFVKLFIKKKFRALRRQAEASQRSGKITAPIRLAAPFPGRERAQEKKHISHLAIATLLA